MSPLVPTLTVFACLLASCSAPAPKPAEPAHNAKVIPATPIIRMNAAAVPVRNDARPQDLIGKPPPPFNITKWVKGEPLTEFPKGKVYVVDFWATWCGPCKAAIPHLSRLAQDHKGKIEVIGVSISERQKDKADLSYVEGVQKFVDKMGERMDYRVAVDTPDKVMHTTWFIPTGTGGIPTAYIIDTNGLVAWTGIGAPETIERISLAVLAGTFDAKQEADRVEKEEAEAKQRAQNDIEAARKANEGKPEKFPGYRDAMSRGDSSAALAALDAAFKADPTSETSGAYQWKFMLLMQRNKPEEVNAYAKDLLERFAANGDIMGYVSACIVATGEESRFDNNLALATATISLESAKPDSRWQQFARWRMGWAYFHTGRKDKAIESMKSALEGIEKLKATFDFDGLEDECKEALKTFEKSPAK